jgi:hypothetical protein
MIACHTWDTIGVQAVGWEAGLIKRVNNDVLETAARRQYYDARHPFGTPKTV